MAKSDENVDFSSLKTTYSAIPVGIQIFAFQIKFEGKNLSTHPFIWSLMIEL